MAIRAGLRIHSRRPLRHVTDSRARPSGRRRRQGRDGDRAGAAPARAAARALRAEQSDTVIYPHLRLAVETLDEAVAVCRAVDHPSLGVAFCGIHWYAGGAAPLAPALRATAAHLRSVNLCGFRQMPGTSAGTIEPLDAAALARLRDIGYRGPIGVQGYDLHGDPYANLRRSLTALRELEQRLDDHPEWAPMPRAVGAAR